MSVTISTIVARGNYRIKARVVDDHQPILYLETDHYSDVWNIVTTLFHRQTWGMSVSEWTNNRIAMVVWLDSGGWDIPPFLN